MALTSERLWLQESRGKQYILIELADIDAYTSRTGWFSGGVEIRLRDGSKRVYDKLTTVATEAAVRLAIENLKKVTATSGQLANQVDGIASIDFTASTHNDVPDHARPADAPPEMSHSERPPPGLGLKALCLALPSAMLSMVYWFTIGYSATPYIGSGIGGLGLVLFFTLVACTFGFVFVLSVMGFRGRATAFNVLWVTGFTVLNTFAVSIFGVILASNGLWDLSLVLPTAAGMGVLTATLASFWVRSAGYLEEKDVRAIAWARKGGWIGFVVGFFLGVAAVLILSSQRDSGVGGFIGGRSSREGGIALFVLFVFPAFAVGAAVGYVGMLTGLGIGVIRDLGIARLSGFQRKSTRTPTIILTAMAEKIVAVMTQR
jgi:hypothetical protein